MNILTQNTLRALLLATSSFGLGALTPAAAQQADDAVAAADEEIVVVGQRLAQQRAIDARREAEAIIDAVLADDIGRLADKNVAENVERLPGVSLRYDQGEGRYVSIRGVDGALNNVTVNGVDLGSPVSLTYFDRRPFRFGGKIHKVEVGLR